MKFKKVNNVRLRFDTDWEEVQISTKHLEECIQYINEHNITRIDIVDWYYKGEDLNFLSECPNIEEVSLDSIFIKDISGLSHIKNLKVLALSETTVVDANIEVDLASYPNLGKLYLTWSKKIKGLNQLTNLKNLSLWKYSPKQGNLEELSTLRNLETLSITQSKIKSLKGLESLENLKTLGLYYLRTLKDLTALNQVDIPLIELDFENCKSINDYSPVQNFKKLEKLKTLDCGYITTISFIIKLKELKILSFAETNILDGNLEVCNYVEDVYYTKQKPAPNNGINVDNKEALQQLTKPTLEWKKRMLEGDDMFSIENINAADTILDSFIRSLKNINGKSTESKIMKCVKQVVHKLNELNETNNYFIETMEREELCEFTSQAAYLSGLEIAGDITVEWREW